MLEKDGVDIDEELGTDRTQILSETNLTEIQLAFLREQVEASKKKDSRSHRWHPAMTRFAHCPAGSFSVKSPQGPK